MLQSLLGNDLLVVSILVFVAMMLLLESGYLAWRSSRGPAARKLRHRLEAASTWRASVPQGHLLKQPLANDLAPLERRLQALPRGRWLDRTMQQSGLDWSLTRLLLQSAATALAGWTAATAALHQPLLVGLGAAAALGALPLLYVNHRRVQRLAKIEAQLPEALDLVTRALRAGHAFGAGLKMAGDELAEPISGELRAVHEEVNFGVSMEQALTHLSERVPLTDIRYFVVAVLIQRDSGGNLTEILGNLSRLLRERAKLIAKVRVLSSEGRLSAWVLAVMPFALGGLLNLMNPEFMRPMWTDPMGIAMIKYLLAMMLLGGLVLRKIVRIRY